MRVRGLDTPRDLVAVHFTNGVTVTQPRAWLNGYQSWSTCWMHDVATGSDFFNKIVCNNVFVDDLYALAPN